MTLQIAQQFFCITLQLMMMHHNVKFGKEMFGSLEIIIWINTGISTLYCDLDPEHRNPIHSNQNSS